MKHTLQCFCIFAFLGFAQVLLAQIQTCGCKLELPNAQFLDRVDIAEVANDTLLLSYTNYPFTTLNRITCDGNGSTVDSVAIPYSGKLIFNKAAQVYIVDTDTAHFWITKLNRFGDTLWHRVYDALLVSGNTFINDLEELEDGGLLATAKAYNGTTAKERLLKFSESGDLLWQKEYLAGLGLGKIYPSADHSGNFIVTSYGYYALVIKVDNAGEMLWMTWVCGQGCNIRGLLAQADGSFLLTRHVSGPTGPSVSCYLEKFDAGGTLEKSVLMHQYAPDNLTYILGDTGELEEDAPGEFVFYFSRITPTQQKNLVFVKVNTELDSLCTETYTRQIKTYKKLPSGKFGAIFNTVDFFTATNKLDICAADGCNDATTGASAPGDIDPKFVVYPNPSSTKLKIFWNGEINAIFTLANSYGVEVFCQPLPSENEEIDISHLPNGAYVIYLKSKNGVPITRKLLIVQ
ncbi:MAG: T9SS type A sorting domain-containing protein [Saprospiraceae bacterium]